MNKIDRLDILQEMVNIGFGRSSAAVADLLDVFITMSVPKILDISASKIRSYLIDEIGLIEKVSMVRQMFRGDFCGETVMVFPEWSDSILISLAASFSDHSSLDCKIMQEEMLLELGNIIFGACMGKIAELLDTILSYSVPQIILKRTPISQLSARNFGEERRVLVIENVLSIDEKKAKFYLFIMVNSKSLSWLYQTLDKSLGSFSV